ncbi:hypothetical protein B0H14DRAFT_2576259 [Mycena olivaceomarginata]|nr:hypothetical protein B0H14DRAFT_2576259 [Mycena olivaceomarginata]
MSVPLDAQDQYRGYVGSEGDTATVVGRHTRRIALESVPSEYCFGCERMGGREVAGGQLAMCPSTPRGYARREQCSRLESCQVDRNGYQYRGAAQALSASHVCQVLLGFGHDSSTDEWIIKFMPSSAYGIAANLLVTEIVDRYREENNTSMSTVCYPSGTRNKTHEDPVFRLTPTRSKQADQSLCSVKRSVESPPVAVVEAGESRTQLVDDACWWLQSGSVNLVILITVGVYPRPVLGNNSLVLPLSIHYADLGIQTTNNLRNNTLVVPMDRWAAVVWKNMG